jgi:hypothetical protein
MVRETLALALYSALVGLALVAPGALALGCSSGGGGGGGAAPSSSGQSCIGGCSYSTGCGTLCKFSTFQCNTGFCCPPGRTCGDGVNGQCGACLP